LGASAARESAAAVGDGTLVGRVYRTASLFFLIALLLSLGTLDARLIVGMGAGFALAMGVLWSWQWIVRRGLRPQASGAPPSGRWILGVGLVKLPVVGVLILALIGTGLVHAGWFALGFAIPQVAAVAVLAGRRLGRLNGTDSGRGTGERHVVASR
jgi:hypothetical protein